MKGVIPGVVPKPCAQRELVTDVVVLAGGGRGLSLCRGKRGLRAVLCSNLAVGWGQNDRFLPPAPFFEQKVLTHRCQLLIPRASSAILC